MKIKIILLFSASIVFALACEDPIDVELPTGEEILVVDAWLNDKPEDQVVVLSTTLPYFANEQQPMVSGAAVVVVDDLGNEYVFSEREKGMYYWTATAAQPTLGIVGSFYQLLIEVNGEQYTASSYRRGAPAIDSISLTFEPGNSFIDDYYYAEFWAQDLIGEGDAYWIRTSKNGQALNKPSEISLAFDAGFTEGGNFDGVTFIQPIRQSINPFDEDANGALLSPYWPGDSVHVEIHSITVDAYRFLYELAIATNRPGGFSELFVAPLSNVFSNVNNTDVSKKNDVVGFFNVSTVSSFGKRFQ